MEGVGVADDVDDGGECVAAAAAENEADNVVVVVAVDGEVAPPILSGPNAAAAPNVAGPVLVSTWKDEGTVSVSPTLPFPPSRTDGCPSPSRLA